MRGASRKAPLCSFQKANICPRERWLQSLRFLANFGARRFPKGNEGKRVSSGYNRRRRLATRSSGKQQAERTAVRTAPIVCPEGSPLVRPQAQDFFPAGGLTRRLRRGSRACSPMGRSHFSFVGERKVCKRKPAARRLQEKGFYCPFWRRGRNVARNEVGQLPPALGARSCSPFSAVKMGGPFSLRCLSPLCFAAGGAGQTQTAMLGMLRCDRDDSTARKNRLDFYSVVGINRTQIMSVWIFRHVLEFPET